VLQKTFCGVGLKFSEPHAHSRSGPAVAYSCMKDNLDYAATSGFLEASLDYEAENMIRTAQTRDHREAVRAFVEKRRPRFNGH
jgi:enoyl-CoA hydratase/carnithine racemase